MKTEYAIEGEGQFSIAKAGLLRKTSEPFIALVCSIVVDWRYRGKGHASELLRQICTDADSEGMDLRLVVAPLSGKYGKASLTKEQLFDFYGRYGFARTHDNHMLRRHQSKDHPAREYQNEYWL